MTVINYGDGGYPQGIAIESAVNFPRMTDVFVIVEGANTKNTGVVITDSRAMIDSMRVWTSDGAEALGSEARVLDIAEVVAGGLAKE